MKPTSILVCIVVIVSTYEVRQALSSAAAANQTLEILKMRENCESPLKAALACLQRKYRTFDGTCNNLCNITLGSAERPLVRLLPSDYEGPAGSTAPRSLGVDFKPLTNCRKVSFQTLKNNDTANSNDNAVNFTHLTMTWGQFLDHDVTLTELTPNTSCGVNNAPCQAIPDCVNIKIPNGEELLFNQSAQCIPLIRSARDGDGNQINEITSYMDGSQVYGSSEEVARILRSPKGHGLLDTVPLRNVGDRPRLPNADEEAFCRSPNPEEEPCFLAGDIRVNENQALMAMHTLWVREHNRIATNLKLLRPYADDETLFQEARKIVIAQLQHITYNEWLPVLFDESLRKESRLLLNPKGTSFTEYDPQENPETRNVFSTAVLRMGHSLIRPTFTLRTGDGFFRRFGGRDRTIKPFLEQIEPRVDFFNPERFFNKGELSFISRILVGLTAVRARAIDKFFSNIVREGLIIEGPTPDGIVGDLPAINCQRARDHGLPGYTKYREALGLGKVTRFSDLLDTFSQKQIDKFKLVYKNVKDIDMFIGGITENPAPRSRLGSVFTAIMIKQFRAYRFGDRFWYERDDHQTGFTLTQLDEIRKSSMARVLCDNLDGVTFTHERVFENRFGQKRRACSDLDYINLKEFSQGAGVESSGGEGNTGNEENTAA